MKHKKVSIRAKKYVKNKIEGMSDYQAATQAGYSHNTAVNARKNIENHGIRNLLEKEMEKEGISDKQLVRALGEGLKNSFKAISSPKGPIFKPDYVVRHKYLVTALRLRGLFPPISASVENKEEKYIEIKIVEDTTLLDEY